MSKKRSLEWLRARAGPALVVPELVEIARSANSPMQAYQRAINLTNDADLAKACQRSAAIKRDHGKNAFEETVLSVTSNRPRSRSTGIEKGAIKMEDPRISQFGELSENSIMMGRRFLFLLSGLKDTLGDLDVSLPKIINLVGDGEANILGVKIQKSRIDEVPIAGVCPVKMLFEPDETAYVLVSYPLKAGKMITIETSTAGEVVEKAEVKLDKLGCYLYTIKDLMEGDYTVSILGTEVSSNFTVARYQLVPLHAVFAKGPEMLKKGKKVTFSAELRSFGVPVEGKVKIELMAGKSRVDSTEKKAHEGLVSAQFDLPDTEKMLTINFIHGDDSATLPIRGGKKSQRTPFRACPLGRIVEISTLPPGDETRGLYFSTSAKNNEPFEVEEIVGNTVTIKVQSNKVQCAIIVVVDPVKREISHEFHPRTNRGDSITFGVPDPYGIVFIGAVVDGKPYEAYTMAVRPSGLDVKVNVPERVEPGVSATIGIETNQPDKDVDVLVTVTDGRAVMPETATTVFASSIKKGAETLVSGMEPGEVKRPILPIVTDMDFMPHIYSAAGVTLGAPSRRRREPRRYRSSGPRLGGMRLEASVHPDTTRLLSKSMSLDAPAAELCLDAATMDDTVAKTALATSPASDVLSKLATSFLLEAGKVREKRPEVVLCSLITVKGSASVSFQAPESITTLNVSVQVVSGFDTAAIEEMVEVSKALFCELVVSPFVGKGDKAMGRLTVGSMTGSFKVNLMKDGESIPLNMDGMEVLPDLIHRKSATLAFDVEPGEYVAEVIDTEANRDSVTATVSEPGKIQYLAKTVQLIEPGQEIALQDAEDILKLIILPSIAQQLDVTTRVTACYEHSCCEQTATIVASNALAFMGSGGGSGGSSGGDDNTHREAESAIIAGIRREERMHLPGQGFTMYPDSGHVDSHYSPMAARRLLSCLRPLSETKKLSKQLKDACKRGIEMAEDAAKAHGIQIPPKKVGSCADAYEVVSVKRTSKQAVDYVTAHIKTEGSFCFIEGNGAVNSRSETAYAAAVLLVAGKFMGQAVQAANWVMGQMNDKGSLYSTVDSFALIALLGAISQSGLAVGDGDMVRKVEVNGEEMTIDNAIEFKGDITNVRMPDDSKGIVAVQVIRIRTEDWDRFLDGAKVTVGLRQAGAENWISGKVTPGQSLELVMIIDDGYQVGDLCHICLPQCLSFVFGGGQVKKMAIDPEGKDEVVIPIAVTSATDGSQQWGACMRNMFQEERGGNPGMSKISVSAAA